MLRPDEIEDLPARVLAVFDELEVTLRAEAASRITAEGADRAAVRAALAAKSYGAKKDIEQSIADTIADAALHSLNTDEEAYAAARAAGLIAPYAPLSRSVGLQRTLSEGVATAQSLLNMVRTSAEQAVYTEFVDALDSAMVSLVTENADPAHAVRKAVDAIARTESRVTYDLGGGQVIEQRLYGAVRRAVVTSANQTTLRMQEARLMEVGASYVEVTAHMGARPEHAEWQGGVYLFSELPAITGYGEVDGLGGANCRHSWFPFFPQIMEPTDFAYLDDSAEQAEQYELSQRQRESERNIRRYQARSRIYSAAGERDEAERNRGLVKKWQGEADAVAAKRNGARRRDREVGRPSEA